MLVKSSDWVTTKSGGRGIVQRVAKDGRWADVNWTDGRKTWSKRMPTESLIVQTTIKCWSDWEVTDITREREIKEANQHAQTK